MSMGRSSVAARELGAVETGMVNGVPLRVGIDARELVHPQTGIGRYTTELCKVLDQLLPCGRFFLYSNRPIYMPVQSPRWVARVDGRIGVSHLHPLAWLIARGGSLCRPDQLDAYWGAATVLPRLPKSVRSIVTVYDLFHLNRNLVSLKRLLAYGLLYNRSLARADSIVTISETTTEKLQSVLGYRAAAIVRPGISQGYRSYASADIRDCLRLHGISAPYIFAVASRYEPRKNLDSLLEAFCTLKLDGLIPEHTLVLGGAGGVQAVARASFARKTCLAAIMSPGIIPEEQLPLLYCGADAFILPSTHEGFGIPVLEARACGTRVIATDIPELREAGGKDATYVSPTPDGIRDGIIRALRQPPKVPAEPLPEHSWHNSGLILAGLLAGRRSGEDAMRQECV